MKSIIRSVWSFFSKSHTAEERNSTSGTEKQEHIKRLSDAVKDKSKQLEPQTGSIPAYKISLEEEKISVDGCKCFHFGKNSNKCNRTIMVLGATGAGKTTLINGMINYILGVKWEYSYRFKLVDEDQSKSQAHSQTSEVTVYKLNHQKGFKIEHSLTIVDTPGFGDTRGIERDKEITEQLHKLFTAKLGVSEIDAVCFVAQAALARLTPTQKYVFDSVLSIFGKDIAENIRVLVTFADGQKPPVLEAIKASGVPCPVTKEGQPLHFKFNNSALYADNKSYAADSMSEDDEEESFDEMFWGMGTKSMKRFFAALNVMDTKSLTMTKEVLRERQRLEISVENLQKQVKVGLAKLEEINQTTDILREHEAEISRNKDFEFEVTVTKPVQEDISGTRNYITNCQQCHVTCHYPCGIPDDTKKAHCTAMGPDGNCTQCPGKCYWNVHFNQKYRWEYKEVKEKQTVKELEKKYLAANEAKAPVQALIEKLKAEYDDVQAKVVKFMERSAQCLNRLKEIALRPNPLSTPEYIDMLIEGEKSEAQPGWMQRVQALMAMREKAETMAELERGERPLTMTKEVLRERQQLEISVENLQKQVKDGLAKLEEIKETTDILREHEAEISRNKDFKFEVTCRMPSKEDISGTGKYTTNCQQCDFTCHYPCEIPSDADKKNCSAMGPDGNCTECPGKCYWNVHFHQNYIWRYKAVREEQTVKDLEKKYLKATGAEAPVQALIERLTAEYDDVQAEVVKCMERSAQCLNTLRPNPLSTSEYIDMFIEGEKSEAQPGWKQRVQALMDMREKAETMAELERGERPLTMTKEVLRERQQLEISVENLQKQVKDGLAKLEEIKEPTDILREHEAEISRNKDFKFEVTCRMLSKEDISGTGKYTTNCQQCDFTCHYPCEIPNDADKKNCSAMGPDGNCTECPGKCYWNVHFHQNYIWRYKAVREEQTVQDLEKKYLKATGAEAPVQALIERLKAEYDDVQAEVVKCMERSAQCLNTLRPNPLSTSEYIDMLIEGEKSEAQPGWMQRVQALMDMSEKS